MWLTLLSIAFTILAGFLTTVLFGRNQSVGVKNHATRAAEALPPCREPEERTNSSKEAPPGLRKPRAESECTARTNEDLLDEPCPSNQEEGVGDQCEQAESENDEFSHSLSGHVFGCRGKMQSTEEPVNRMDEKDQALKYMPGMLRTSQLERMMSKEELEEEQRVQQEQLTAIFKLLKENQETFGDVTEKDMEEQLKLYSI